MKISHIAIYTFDMEVMKAFYMNYFNASSNAQYFNETKNFKSYFLTFAEGPRLELMHRPDVQSKAIERDQEHLGLIHFAISLGSKKAVDELTERLRRDGYQIVGEPRTTGDGYYESVVTDPEQNRIELTV